MTFVEAAVEVLKREGKPLPVKRLADLAVQNNLLSVVGRDPEGTMQLRLADAIASHRDLVEVRPGVYGLRAYPAKAEAPKAEPKAEAKAEAAKPEAKAEADAPAPGKKSRSRRKKPSEAKSEAKAEKAEAKPEKAEAKPKAEKEGGKRRRGRRGGRGRGKKGAETAVETSEETAAEEAAPEAAEPAAPEAAPEPVAAESPAEAAVEAPSSEPAVEGESLEEGELLEDDEIDLPGGPLLAPSHGAEELTRSDEERTVRAEIHGRREERGRFRRDRRDRRPRDQQQQHQQHGREQRPQHHQQQGQQHQGQQQQGQQQGQQPAQPPQPQGQPSGQQPQQPQQQGRRSVLDAVLELLRQSDGRPMHVRHLTDLAVKKGMLAGQPNELYRQVRAALVRELRERESEGLRARVRSLGGGNYAPIDRKLDQDLAQAERELAEKAARQREATKMALRRRLGRLSPPAFEALGRVLLDKLGVTGVELVRRGEGVAYFGGVRPLGAGALKVLIALRPGEAEINRRAVGELRAGLQARGYDEGLLFAAGRLGGDGAAELKNGSGVVVHDGLSLATLLVKHGLGVRRLHLPVDYLDLEFLQELSEG